MKIEELIMRARRSFSGDAVFIEGDDFLEVMEEESVGQGMNIVAGAGESVSIHRLDAISWAKKQIKKGKKVFCLNFSLSVNYPDVNDFLNVLLSDNGNAIKIRQYEGTTAIAEFEARDILAICNKTHCDFMVFAYSPDPVSLKELRTKYGKDEKRLKLNWWYPSDAGGFDERDIDFYLDISLHDECYPFIPGGMKTYFMEYLGSNAPILVLMGEPGTGKTTFIRHLINEHSLETVVTYDEKVMESDYFYCQFLTETNKKLMVIEDADLLLRARDEGTNKTMNKLLNVSDGVIQLGKKKIIFSTNIGNINRIDEALIRPGRCFDVLNFRRLTFEEAKKASKAAGLPDLIEDKEYALSEIFNRRQHSYYSNRFGLHR